MEHLIDLDEEALDAARQRLRTSSLGDTVNAALRLAAERSADDRDVDDALGVLARIEFDDRAEAWR